MGSVGVQGHRFSVCCLVSLVATVVIELHRKILCHSLLELCLGCLLITLDDSCSFGDDVHVGYVCGGRSFHFYAQSEHPS